MIKLENTEVVGWEAAIRGMRNPMNSWEKIDSKFYLWEDGCTVEENVSEAYIADRRSQDDCYYQNPLQHTNWLSRLGPNDQKLMMRLRNAGTDHRKFMRMVVVYVDILAPLYWWKEFDTYKVGTVANSCSTMHKIADKEFTMEDFSTEHLIEDEPIPCRDYSPFGMMEATVYNLNKLRELYLNGFKGVPGDNAHDIEAKRKDIWWQLIQLLPSSYNQRRTVMLNYEVLANIYPARKNHKLDEWHDFCRWIEGLPFAVLITGTNAKEEL